MLSGTELDLLRSRIDAVRMEGLDNEYWLKAQARFTDVQEARDELLELAQSRPLDEAKLKGMLDQAVRLGVPKDATDHVEGKLQKAGEIVAALSAALGAEPFSHAALLKAVSDAKEFGVHEDALSDSEARLTQIPNSATREGDTPA